MCKAIWITVVASIFYIFVSGAITGNNVLAESKQDTIMFGCLPGGSVFNHFSPDNIALREVAFITPFGTMNTNIVVGQSVDAAVVIEIADLSERMGEFLTAINTTALINQVAIIDKDVPDRYLKDKTMILCGGPKENNLVLKLVQDKKSTVAWNNAKDGHIEVIDNAFGGTGTAIIAGGATPEATSRAIAALTGFFAHIAGANLAEEGLLQADRALRHGNVTLAAKGIEKLINGLRLDGSIKIDVPVLDAPPDFSDLLKAEAKEAQALLKLLRKNPALKDAEAGFQKLAGFCAYCHDYHLAYNRSGQNRNQFHYVQFPMTRCETEWATVYKQKDGKMVERTD